MNCYRSFLLFIGSLFLIIASCKTPKPEVASIKGPPTMAHAPVIIYKTKADYSKNVPVILSDDKKSIVSYPAPGDVYFKGELAYPVQLAEGFLLDRRGISENAAFTRWTYEEYSNMRATPSTNEILDNILDANPFSEMYLAGTTNNYSDMVNELNNIIMADNLSKFKRIK